MRNRLPFPWGSRIDRNAPLTFSFEGRPFEAFEGDTIASALFAGGQKVLSRSFKYHRPRGILSLAGQDANTLVQIEDEPNVRADMRPVRHGMAVTAQNITGSLDKDRGAILGRFGAFMPVGFYYRTFYRPGSRSWVKLWEPMIRKAAGLGTVSFKSPGVEYRKANLHCDVLVVGAGPAGLSAALTATKAGADVILVDENPAIGGALNYARFDIAGRLADETLSRLGEDASRQANLRIMTDAACNGWYADNWLPVLQGNRLFKVRAAEVVLATGSLEQPLVFRNNDLPGIMLSSAVQRLMRCFAVKPGQKAVVFAGSIDGYRAALDLADVGISIAALVEPRKTALGEAYRVELKKRGVSVMSGAMIVEAHGGSEVEAVTIVDAKGRQVKVACDLVAIATGYTPCYQLALHAGAKLRYSDETEHFDVAEVPAHMRLAGSAASVFGLDAVLRSGEIAGAGAAKSRGFATDELIKLPDPEREVINFRGTLEPNPKGRDFIDFDEDLQVKDIWNAVSDGYRELELVKRFSTVGMGPSQGRHSALNTARIVAAATGRTVDSVGVTTSRPPFGPERLGALAGPDHTHFRHTALHGDLCKLGAKMIPAGAWWRPAHFGDPAKLKETVGAEVDKVRNNVGMLDVSTLGKLAIRGRDSGAFLDRVYTMMHSTQPAGRVRYCLMLNEMGSVIDDGVAYRINDDHFHVTTTTGMSARVYSEMSWLNAQWGMDVDIQNLTGAFSGLNVTGPAARAVLQDLEGDIDFSGGAFKYMEGRTGTLAGCPVHAMRIGFTGELSYEIHLPYSKTHQFWRSLSKAGERHGLSPYGLEASRILRLEKGHIIIGQDTDALTTPDELSMEWALSKKKSFFIGKTALQHRRQFPASRKLCGFTHDGDAAGLIAESCLVFGNGRPVGFVSSFGYSPTLKKWIGLAYASPDDALPGKAIAIRTLKGEALSVPVVSAHFFDPQNNRQNI